MEREAVRNIITIGTSAGGIAAVCRLMAALDKSLDAAVFVVIHVSRNSMTDVIVNLMQKQTDLRCKIPHDGEEIHNRTVYLAPADHHMMIEQGKIIVQKGAFENHWRPSVDVLFRSAAAAYGACVTGVVLTGLLDDGTSGMYAIKRSGGVCMVQEPAEAEFPDMPNSVLNNLEVDYKVSIDEMGYVLSDLFSRKNCETGLVPADVKLEAEITRRMSSNVEALELLGSPTPFTCPDCGGILVKISDDMVPRYRCYTGHSFTEESLESEQIKGLEDSLWVAIRMMEERKNLLLAMAKHTAGSSTDQRKQRVEGIEIHIARLKSMLMNMGNTLKPDKSEDVIT